MFMGNTNQLRSNILKPCKHAIWGCLVDELNDEGDRWRPILGVAGGDTCLGTKKNQLMLVLS